MFVLGKIHPRFVFFLFLVAQTSSVNSCRMKWNYMGLTLLSSLSDEKWLCFPVCVCAVGVCVCVQSECVCVCSRSVSGEMTEVSRTLGKWGGRELFSSSHPSNPYCSGSSAQRVSASDLSGVTRRVKVIPVCPSHTVHTHASVPVIQRLARVEQQLFCSFDLPVMLCHWKCKTFVYLMHHFYAFTGGFLWCFLHYSCWFVARIMLYSWLT